MHNSRPKAALRSAGVLLSALAAAFPAFGADTPVTLEAVEVVGVTPLPGLGIPKSQIPSNVQSIGERQLEEGGSVSLAEAMGRRLTSINLNEAQGNPYQTDLNFRGFTASPLLGTAQGLSVYVDGVRINEPFGDTVNWDLVPNFAMAGMDLIPGSNPVFGLNTLGGALAIRTKSGFTHPGGKVELSGGSFDRSDTEFEFGGNNGTIGWYAGGNWFREDGWRDNSPSDVKQFFGKLSFRNAAGEADLALTHATTQLIGNGLIPESMFAQRRESIFTHPDETRNDMTQLALNGKLWLSDASSLSVNLYHRYSRTRTLNGDGNDNYENDYDNWVTNGSILGDEPLTGVNNRSRTVQRSSGGALQWNLTTRRHQLAVGASLDYARMRFQQTEQAGNLDASRGVSADLGDIETANQLRGTTRTGSLYVTDTYELAPSVHLTAAARYNMSRVTTTDEHNPGVPNNLDGNHSYRKLNPSLGITWQVQPALNAYTGFSQGNRIPTPIELGCADPANPCSLPNAMAADPYLKQVVARTLEVGMRGKLDGDIRWNAGVYRTLNTDDILFVGTGGSQGYFTNFGKTQRQGLELGLSGSARRFDWHVGYSWLQATFRSSACILAENNSTRGTTPECTASGQDDEILVQKGDNIPGLPKHSLKLGLSWRATDWLRVGGDVQAFSGQYARGNENNQHQSGTYADVNNVDRTFEGKGRLPGYAILNLNADANLGGSWQLFAKVNNVFDKRYATSAALAENPFVLAGNGFDTDPDNWRRETFVAPGAPRSAWIGIRYVFDDPFSSKE